ncbi:unnamed protein product, partial [Oppiella nova]
RAICPLITKGFKCFCQTDSSASIWCPHRDLGITTSWVRHDSTMKYELQLSNPKEFYHENHRIAHFSNFSTIEDSEYAGADREDHFS